MFQSVWEWRGRGAAAGCGNGWVMEESKGERDQRKHRTKSNRLGLTRRQMLALMGAAAGGQLCHALPIKPESIAPQPYFACVNRAVEAMAALGAPLADADGRRIAELTHINDAASVNLAEALLNRYTLARISDGPARSCMVVCCSVIGVTIVCGTGLVLTQSRSIP